MSFLEDFQANIEALPNHLRRKYALLRDLDKSLHGVQTQNEQRCEKEIEDMVQRIKGGNVTPDSSLIKFSDEALDEQKHAIRIADEKVALASQAYDLVDAHIQQLDQYLKKFDEELRLERDNAAVAGAPTTTENTVKSGRSGEGKGGRKKTRLATAAAATPSGMDLDLPVDPNEPTYCFCNQVSYGEMVACDNPNCKIEWFHYGCVGLKEQPKGKWFCADCAGTQKKRRGK
ncbi:PHD finger protein ING1 [Capsicum chacoense]